VFPLQQIAHVEVSQRLNLKLFGCGIIFEASRGKEVKERFTYVDPASLDDYYLNKTQCVAMANDAWCSDAYEL